MTCMYSVLTLHYLRIDRGSGATRLYRSISRQNANFNVQEARLNRDVVVIATKQTTNPILTCYRKAPFVIFYGVVHKMRYSVHGSFLWS